MSRSGTTTGPLSGGVTFCLAVLLCAAALTGVSKADRKYLTRAEMLRMVPCRFDGVSFMPEGKISGEIRTNGVIEITLKPRYFFAVLHLRGKWWLTENDMVCRRYGSRRKRCRFVSKDGSTFTFHNSAGRPVSRITCR